jgi:hypothetical protein
MSGEVADYFCPGFSPRNSVNVFATQDIIFVEKSQILKRVIFWDIMFTFISLVLSIKTQIQTQNSVPLSQLSSSCYGKKQRRPTNGYFGSL